MNAFQRARNEPILVFGRHYGNHLIPPLSRFGLSDLEPGQFALVSNDNLLWLRTLWLMCCAADGNDDVECTIEQPRDPAEWKGDVDLDKMPSFLVWEETQQAVKRLRLKKVTLDQGALGHVSRKPTCLLTRSPELLALDGLPGGPTQEVSWPTELQDRLRFSKSLASWAPGLKDQVAKVIRRFSKLPANSTKAVRALCAGELSGKLMCSTTTFHTEEIAAPVLPTEDVPSSIEKLFRLSHTASVWT